MNPPFELDFETLEKHPELQSDPGFLQMSFGGSLVDEIDKEMMGTIPNFNRRSFQDTSISPHLTDTVIVGQNALARSSSYDVTHTGGYQNQYNQGMGVNQPYSNVPGSLSSQDVLKSKLSSSGKIRSNLKNFSTDNYPVQHNLSRAATQEGVRFQNPPPSHRASAAPYPNREAIQKSRSHGSLDRAKGLMRSDSTLNRSTSNLSSVEEEDDDIPQGERTFSWLEHFKEPNKPKKPVFKACVNCKKAHLACDTSRPCKRCVHLGKTTTCVDVEHKKRGRPKSQKNLNPQELKELEEQKLANQGQGQLQRSASDVKNGIPQRSVNMQHQYIQDNHGHSHHGHSHHDFEEVNPMVLTSNYIEHEDQYTSVEPTDMQFLSVHNLEGVFSMASTEGTTMFGYSEEEFLGSSLYTFIHPDDYMQLTDLHASIVAIGADSQKTVVVRFKNKQGEYVHVEIAMAGMKNPATGSLESIVCSTRVQTPSYGYGDSYSNMTIPSQFDQNPAPMHNTGRQPNMWQPQQQQQQPQRAYSQPQLQQQRQLQQLPQSQQQYYQAGYDYPTNYQSNPNARSQPLVSSNSSHSLPQQQLVSSLSSSNLPLSSSSLSSSIPNNINMNQIQPSPSSDAISGRLERMNIMRSDSTHRESY